MSDTKFRGGNEQVSIIVPTYNESQNILSILKSIEENLPKNKPVETIVVDDNSPDGTGNIVEEYINSVKKATGYTVGVIRRKAKEGLSSAILKGIEGSKGQTIIVMDSDRSHPPDIIPKMVDTLANSECDIVVASRYVKGGSVSGWSVKRKLISKVATKIAQQGLGVGQKDPLSGFFAFKRNILDGLKLDAIGYKMLLEILVKTKGVRVKEIPYTFTNRMRGESKLGTSTVFDYLRSVWKLYRYGTLQRKQEKRTSIRFLSKAARFYTVGAFGLAVNYLISLLFATGITSFWYLHANIIGIIASMTTNFVLNKIWTFEDRDFTPRRTLIQYGKFVGFSSVGALVQLGFVFYLVENYSLMYPHALVLAVIAAAFGNYILNKKWTFKENVWE
ncbi:MAG: glycosyltransferase family 2 protein [Nitrosopumilaceae archaeon]|nr:glycosyltransferase family 2 protein [Nitrosopumilaceae archaeon]